MMCLIAIAIQIVVAGLVLWLGMRWIDCKK